MMNQPITNGGTGYIGFTESVGQARMPMRYTSMGGEATTMINGQPNVNPEATMANSAGARAAMRTMGGSAGGQATLPVAVQVPMGNRIAMETVGVGEITYDWSCDL